MIVAFLGHTHLYSGFVSLSNSDIRGSLQVTLYLEKFSTGNLTVQFIFVLKNIFLV